MSGDENLLGKVTDVEAFLALSFRGMAAMLDVSEETLYTKYADRTAVRKAFAVKGEAELLQAISSDISGRKGLNAALLLAKAYLRFAKHRTGIFSAWRSNFMMHVEERGSSAFWQFLRLTVQSTQPALELETACLGVFAIMNGFVLMQASHTSFTDMLEGSIRALLASSYS